MRPKSRSCFRELELVLHVMWDKENKTKEGLRKDLAPVASFSTEMLVNRAHWEIAYQ